MLELFYHYLLYYIHLDITILLNSNVLLGFLEDFLLYMLARYNSSLDKLTYTMEHE